ncbi:MAG: right-handed parallel beta-helix repeat-containing protein [Nitrospira sp.]|nr:MAG: right-handed parallel beta-helix repeat-containing protein [Nitrospira sp.]
MLMKPLRLPYHILAILYGTYILVTFLQPVTAQGATYYVATTGSDSNPGTSTSPWRNPKKCAAAPIRAGDTCIVRSGSYTDTDGDGTVVWIYNRTTTPSGTASQPITIKSEKPLGASIVVPSNRIGYGFIVQKPYYIIQGFDISGGNNSGVSGAGVGIYTTSSGSGTIIRSNTIHHIGRAACTNSTATYSGVVIRDVSGVLVEHNRIYSIGRRRTGESGCVAIMPRHDHGIYISNASNATIRRNVIYDSNRGYPIHAYGGTMTNLSIYHNTLSGKSPTGTPVGHILLSTTINTANIKNNMSNGAQSGMIYFYQLKASKLTIDHNISTTLLNVKARSSVAGATFTNNFEKISSLGIVNASANDFRLASGSAAINRGTTSGVPSVPDGAPDTAAYEYSALKSLSSPTTPTGLTGQ